MQERPFRGAHLNVTDHTDLVEAVARSYSNRYDHVEFDDCQQELFLHLLKPSVQRSIERSLDPGKNAAFQVWARGHGYEREMRRQGLIFAEDQYHYSPEVVKAALRVGLSYRRANVEPVWPVGDEEDSGVRPANDPAEGNNLQAMMVDVLGGFDALPTDDRRLLEMQHLFGITQVEIAARRQCTVEAVESAHRRAINRLIDGLGGARRRAVADHDGPGSRRVVSGVDGQRMVEM